MSLPLLSWRVSGRNSNCMFGNVDVVTGAQEGAGLEEVGRAEALAAQPPIERELDPAGGPSWA